MSIDAAYFPMTVLPFIDRYAISPVDLSTSQDAEIPPSSVPFPQEKLYAVASPQSLAEGGYVPNLAFSFTASAHFCQACSRSVAFGSPPPHDDNNAVSVVTKIVSLIICVSSRMHVSVGGILARKSAWHQQQRCFSI